MRRFGRWLGVRLLAVALGWTAWTAVAFAASDFVVTVPAPLKGSVRGLTLTMRTLGIDARGYRPIHFEVNCSPATPADRRLTLELAAGPYGLQKVIKVSTEIEIPAGASQASHVLLVPQYTLWQNISLDVWEDGDRLDDLCIPSAPVAMGSQLPGLPPMPAILFVADGPVDYQQLEFLAWGYGNTPQANSHVTGQIHTMFSLPRSIGSFYDKEADKLEDNWLGYTQLDLVFIALDDARRLEQTKPEVWRALVRWTRAGGNLCVHGVGGDWGGLAELERLLGVVSPAAAPRQPWRDWQKPLDSANLTPIVVNPAMSPPPAKPIGSDEMPFVTRQLMMGQLAAIADSKPFPGDGLRWQWLFDSLEPSRWTWRTRHGMSCDSPNPDFDNLLIPEIGLPPVGAYRVLITLFVLGIGPVNFWLLRRFGRLHLLLFTVPAAAAVVSLSLVSYMFVADGFASRLRARSYTEIDQRTGQAASWARLSYYVGLSPSEGLKFSDDVAVIPLEKLPWSYAEPHRREMNWDGGQNLTRGWLYSRTPTQYLTLRSHATSRGLKITPVVGSNQLDLTNQLGTRIRYLMLAGQGGEQFFAHDLAEGADLRLAPMDVVSAAEKLAEMMRQLTIVTPRTPADIATAGTDVLGMRRSRRRYYFGTETADQMTTQSLLERQLQRVTAGPLFNGLEPGSYVAIVDRPGEVETGIDELTETQSLHIIRGRW